MENCMNDDLDPSSYDNETDNDTDNESDNDESNEWIKPSSVC